MYQALYRKYRPKDFDSVVGQDSIVKTLKNSIIHQNFSHAYMFFGSRGTGKTSVSKIFARNVNCLNPKDGNACGKCDNCINSFSKECVDIIEIDAASNNGVDEIRELKNNVNLVPSNLKYKVYIVDEVHMLSDSAFNALLKTLEEPPAHVIFILATTDPQKVPETIVSRCQCFSFKRISDEVILKRLEFICKEEKIDIDPLVLKKISLICDGGLRDALGLLDKLVSYNSSKITIDDFNEINGIISDEDIKEFIDHIFMGNISDVMNKITDFNNCGKNLIQIIIQIIDYCRNILIDYYVNHNKIDYSVDYYLNFINSLNEKMNDIKKSGNPKIYFEMFLLNFINNTIIDSNSPNNTVLESKEVKNNIVEKSIKEISKEDSNINNDKLDSKVLNDAVVEKNAEEELIRDVDDNDEIESIDHRKILNLDEINKIRINNSFATAEKSLLKKELESFELLNDYVFDQKIGYIVSALLDSKIRVVGTDNMIISFDSDGVVEQNMENYEILNEIYNKITNSNKRIAIVSNDEWEKLKDEYIKNKDNKDYYIVQDEPKLVFEEKKKDDIIINSAISLFGEDVVEVE